MRRIHDENSLLETECLFGETVEVLDKYSDWVNCRLTTDNYVGWVKAKDLGKLKKTTHRVVTARTYIYKDTSSKSDIVIHLPMGSQLSINNIENGWAETSFWINNKIKLGYVPSTHFVENDYKSLDWVAKAQQLEGTPYKWGGRDSTGIDCSSLLQLSYQTYGQSIPRNTSEQINLKKSKVSQIDDLKRGCVIFWKGHVGIMIDRLNCIHANAYHMKTVTEPLIDIIDRMDKDHQIVKMMDFNE